MIRLTPWLRRRQDAGAFHSGGNAPARERHERGLTWPVRARFYENAIEMLPEGHAPARILKLLSQELLRLRRKASAQAVNRVAEAVEDGLPLADAFGDRMTDLERNLLEIGEARSGEGGLVQMMKDILESRARMQRLTEVAWSSMFDPIVYLLTMYLFFYVLGAYIMPSIEQVMPPSRWDASTRALSVMGWVGVGNAPIVLTTSVAVFCIVVTYSLPRWSGGARCWVERNLFIFTFYRELHGLLWLLGFSVQTKNGVPEGAALAQQIKGASPWLASRLRPIYYDIVKGEALGVALRNTGHAFPSPALIERIAVLDSGHADALERMARTHIEKLEKRMRRITYIAGLVSLFGIFAVIGLVSIASNGLSANLATGAGM
ncbi:type II secretion system F family protein [Burkholderia gladioli]|uniref:type II secretion system F family protein n=1 Tax=Burkholderia gladioli TaxID=28095 RepID=UPI0016413BE2|nr:type II secretion system F family protein [Burkholderia gladioli]